MNARLSSLLVAGGMLLAGSAHGGSLCADVAEGQRPVADPPTLTDVRIDAGNPASFTLTIPNFSAQPAMQVLQSPDRVVMDFAGVIKGEGVNRKKTELIKTDLIKKVRIAQFASLPHPVTRVVLEVEKGAKVSLAAAAGVFTVQAEKGQDQVRVQALNAEPVQSVVEQVTPVAPPVSVAETLPVAPASASPVEPAAPMPVIGGTYAPLPALAMATVSAPARDTSTAATATLARTEDPKAPVTRTLGDAGQQYTGARLTIDVQGADLVTFLRILADHGKVNLIVDPDVTGTYTFKFVDTPWDQILDYILKHAGLGKEISNGVLRVAKVEKLQKEEEDRKKYQEAKSLAGDLQSISRPLSYAKVSEAVKILEKVITKRGSLIIDERTNTLIVSDLPRNIAVIEDLIAQLDVQIQQVQIEARVVEASKGYEKAFGVKWPQTNSGNANLNTYVSSPTASDPGAVAWGAAPWISNGAGGAWNGINNRAQPGQNSIGLGVTPGKEGVTSLQKAAGEFWVSFLSNRMSLNVILQALEAEGVVKIVSQPKVTTQNNKKATILAGEKIPYPVIQGGGSSGAITVQFADANLQLDVTPQITNEGTIIMDIKVEKAEADFSRTVNGTPTIIRKMIETQVLVQDGGTAVLGGVYTTNTNTGTTGVPFLSKLPILGWLFRSKTNNEKNAELLVFITPRIVKS